MHNKKSIAIGLFLLFTTITAAVGIIENLGLKIIFLLGIALFIATFVAIDILAIKIAVFAKLIHVINNFYLLTGSIKTWVWDALMILFALAIVPSLTMISYPIRVFMIAFLGVYAGASLILWFSYIYRSFFKKRDLVKKENFSEIFQALAAKALSTENLTTEETREKISKFLHDLTAEENKVKPIETAGNK